MRSVLFACFWIVAASACSNPTSDCSVDSSNHNKSGKHHGRECLTASKANCFVNSFKTLLEFTNYNGTLGPKGRGFNQSLAEEILAPDFKDISDSINLLARQPPGSVTFPSRAAFIAGQGAQPEVAVTITNVWFNCKTITFRYSLLTSAGPNLPVVGINVMELDEKLQQVKVQYAEFNSGAWLVDLGNPQCQSQGGSGTRRARS